MAKKSAKKLGKKDLKKTKGGILIGLNQPALKITSPTISPSYKELGGDSSSLNFVKF